jgi:hypothetical protein
VVGTPQFEPYVMQNIWNNKEDFYKKFPIKWSKQVIYYSCADVSIGRMILYW